MGRIICNDVIKLRVADNHDISFLLCLIFNKLVGLPVGLTCGDNDARNDYAKYFAPKCSLTSRFTSQSDSRRRQGVPASLALPRENDTNTGPSRQSSPIVSCASVLNIKVGTPHVLR